MENDTLYIGSNGHVVAVEPSSGAELWRTRLGGGLFSATVQEDVCVLEHDRRVFAGCHGHLFCLDAETGAILWQNDLRGLGHNDVTLAIAGKSIQYVAKHTESSAK